MKTRVKLRLRLFLKDKLVLDTTKRKKSQIMLQLERVPHDKGTLRADYDKGFYNETILSDDNQLKNALSAFTAKPLLDSVKSNEWRSK